MTDVRCSFAADEHEIQTAYFQRHLKDRTGYRGRPFQLLPDHKLEGLLPEVHEPARRIFDELNIQWHPFVGHGRSSQACCVNFLMPLADKPEVLERWLGNLLGIAAPKVLPIEDEIAGEHRFVAFEYTGPDGHDFLGEAGGRTPKRGAHATASDAAVAFRGADGKLELLLIEWKYSEEYRNHRLSADDAGKRPACYGGRTFAPDGPIRGDLGLAFTDFLREPFYQLLRQQALAWQIEEHTAFDRVRVLHLSPAGNRALHHVTAPAFRSIAGVQRSDAFAAFRSSLVDPEAFLERSIEEAFAPLAGWDDANWYQALAERYPTLCPAART
jgi:hypothetical protein